MLTGRSASPRSRLFRRQRGTQRFSLAKRLESLPDYIWCNVNVIIPYMELGMICEARARAQEVPLGPGLQNVTALLAPA